MLLTITVLFMYIFTAAKSKSAKSKGSSRHFLPFTARANVSRFSAQSLMFQHPFLVYISVLADQIRVSAGCPSVWIISQIIFHLVMFQNKKKHQKVCGFTNHLSLPGCLVKSTTSTRPVSRFPYRSQRGSRPGPRAVGPEVALHPIEIPIRAAEVALAGKVPDV